MPQSARFRIDIDLPDGISTEEMRSAIAEHLHPYNCSVTAILPPLFTCPKCRVRKPKVAFGSLFICRDCEAIASYPPDRIERYTRTGRRINPEECLSEDIAYRAVSLP